MGKRANLFDQQYRFYNISKCSPNTKGIAYNYCLPWAVALEDTTAGELKGIFQQVIGENYGWSDDDYVLAVGDAGSIYRYCKGTINEYIPSRWELQIEQIVCDLYTAFRDELPLHQMLPPM